MDVTIDDILTRDTIDNFCHSVAEDEGVSVYNIKQYERVSEHIIEITVTDKQTLTKIATDTDAIKDAFAEFSQKHTTKQVVYDDTADIDDIATKLEERVREAAKDLHGDTLTLFSHNLYQTETGYKCMSCDTIADTDGSRAQSLYQFITLSEKPCHQ